MTQIVRWFLLSIIRWGLNSYFYIYLTVNRLSKSHGSLNRKDTHHHFSFFSEMMGAVPKRSGFRFQRVLFGAYLLNFYFPFRLEFCYCCLMWFFLSKKCAYLGGWIASKRPQTSFIQERKHGKTEDGHNIILIFVSFSFTRSISAGILAIFSFLYPSS